MRLSFLGTRGEIERRSREHALHSSLLVEFRGRMLLLDRGVDWRGRGPPKEPLPLLLTHAHPDHAGGLRDGWRGPVYATAEALAALRRFPLDERRVIAPRRPQEIAGMTVEGFPLEHSLRAPAVGYRIAAGRATVLYAPDVAAIGARGEALAGLDLYVGDGAALTRSIVRPRGDVQIGHASIRAQLGWCAEEGVRRAVFTHCGSELVKGEPAEIAARVAELGAAVGVDARVAHDGLQLSVRGGR